MALEKRDIHDECTNCGSMRLWLDEYFHCSECSDSEDITCPECSRIFMRFGTTERELREGAMILYGMCKDCFKKESDRMESDELLEIIRKKDRMPKKEKKEPIAYAETGFVLPTRDDIDITCLKHLDKKTDLDETAETFVDLLEDQITWRLFTKIQREMTRRLVEAGKESPWPWIVKK